MHDTLQVKLLYWSILVYEFEEASVSAAELKADRTDQLLEVRLLKVLSNPCFPRDPAVYDLQQVTSTPAGSAACVWRSST